MCGGYPKVRRELLKLAAKEVQPIAKQGGVSSRRLEANGFGHPLGTTFAVGCGGLRTSGLAKSEKGIPFLAWLSGGIRGYSRNANMRKTLELLIFAGFLNWWKSISDLVVTEQASSAQVHIVAMIQTVETSVDVFGYDMSAVDELAPHPAESRKLAARHILVGIAEACRREAEYL